MRTSACAVIALAFFLAVPMSGCGGRTHNREVRLNVATKPPPYVPLRRDVPIDPSLQESARKTIADALASNEPLTRAHALEAMKEGAGADAADAILKALTDDAEIVRFAG